MPETATANGVNLSRRVVRFASIDQALADVDALAESARQGKLRVLGNWTLGQILGHLATWVRYAYDGTPLKMPLIVRWIFRPLKRRFIYKGMPSGKRIPGVKGGTLGLDVLSTEEGLRQFRQELKRLQKECPTQPQVIFGRLTHEEWINLNLRHCELHLSFLRAE